MILYSRRLGLNLKLQSMVEVSAAPGEVPCDARAKPCEAPRGPAKPCKAESYNEALNTYSSLPLY